MFKKNNMAGENFPKDKSRVDFAQHPKKLESALISG